MKTCPKCKGSKIQYEAAYDPAYPCDECNGIGVVPCDIPSTPEDVAKAVEVLKELVEIVRGHLEDGDVLDSFTLQPAEKVLDSYAAASRWHSIAEDGLPTEEGEYTWRRADEYAKRGRYESFHYSPIPDGEFAEDFRVYTHYQRIEFTEEQQ